MKTATSAVFFWPETSINVRPHPKRPFHPRKDVGPDTYTTGFFRRVVSLWAMRGILEEVLNSWEDG